MTGSLRRREFVVAGGATLWPLAVHAQQSERLRRIGVLMAWAENDLLTQTTVTAFVGALARLGWVEGRNIRIDRRFAAGDPTLFRTYAAELAGLAPDAVLTSSAPATMAVRQQTSTIPIVFAIVPDPIGLGFVQSLARPGGNVTGFSAFDEPLMGKSLQLLKEVAAGVTRVAVLFNPDTFPDPRLYTRPLEDAAPSLGMTVTLAPVHDDAGIEEAIAAQAREPGGGLIGLPDAFIGAHRNVISAAASRHGLPLMGTGDPLPKAGALMSYGFDMVDVHARAASYIDRILKGALPTDLPVQQPTKYSLVINLKTAKALGLTVPQSILQRADEVIE